MSMRVSAPVTTRQAPRYPDTLCYDKVESLRVGPRNTGSQGPRRARGYRILCGYAGLGMGRGRS